MPAVDTLTPAEAAFFDSKGEIAPEAEATPTPAIEVPVETSVAVAEEVPEADEPADEEVPEGEAGKNATKVSIGALHKERKLRKAAEKAAEEQKLENAKIGSRIEVIQQLIQQSQQQPAAPAEDGIPDINVDPVGHFKAKLEKLEAKETERAQQANTITNVQRIGQIATEKEAEYIKVNPEYNAASTFLQEARAKQLAVMGYDAAAIRNTMSQEAVHLAAIALQRGENPAKWVHEMAKAMGWKAAAPEATAVMTPAATPSPDEVKIAMAAKGQNQGSGLGTIAGSASAPMTIENLLKMDDKDFLEATKGDKFRKLLDGAARR